MEYPAYDHSIVLTNANAQFEACMAPNQGTPATGCIL
jgi:hypothetical protein